MIYVQKNIPYSEVLSGVKAIIDGDALADISNLVSYLYHSVKDINWLGIYLVKDGELVVGPFQGKPACVRIPFGKGVCGKCIIDKKTIVVDNVADFSGHIACDTESVSELVIPIFYKKKVVALLDVDSPVPTRFQKVDTLFFETIVAEVLEPINWPSVLQIK